jgi:ATP adenylyltransferase/5',5'''-P-1,P-4-tetraphosphate phosphorylase II
LASLKQKKVYWTHSVKDDGDPLSARIDRLLEDQKRDWKRLADGYASLRASWTRHVDCTGFSVILQFNPQRLASTDARTDEQSIRSRKCFLCVDHLPEEQQGILYKDAFLILFNPAPIFDRHLTISHVEHREQSIEGFGGTLLDLARDLSPSHTVFYNGPKSGASAPDHMHFQAPPANVLPIEKDLTDPKRRLLRRKESSVSLWTLSDYGRQVILLESDDKVKLEEMLLRLLNSMRNVLEVVDEPLVNIICSYARRTWTMIVFPRTKHRPDEFYKQGPERLLISPAAVDMGGFIVTPLQSDFERVTSNMVEGVFRQVSQDAATTGQIIDAL